MFIWKCNHAKFLFYLTMADLCNVGPIQAMYKTLHLAAERTQTSPQSC